MSELKIGTKVRLREDAGLTPEYSSKIGPGVIVDVPDGYSEYFKTLMSHVVWVKWDESNETRWAYESELMCID